MTSLWHFFNKIYYQIEDTIFTSFDRLLLALPVFFGIGIGIYFYLPFEPFLLSSLFFLITSLFFVWDCRFTSVLKVLSLYLFMIAFGFVTAQVRTILVSTPKLKSRTSNVVTSGIVEELTVMASGRIRILLDQAHLEGYEPYATPKKLQISLKPDAFVLNIGDFVTLNALLSPPSLPAIKNGYDPSKALYFDQIGGVGYSVGIIKVEPAVERTSFRVKINQIRAVISSKIRSVLPDETKEIATALVTGSAKGIPQEILNAYRSSGIAHLLAVSGLHLGLIAGFIFTVSRICMSLIPAIALRFNTKKISAILALVGAFLYLLVSGANLPAQRAFILISVAFTGILLNRRAFSIVSIAWAGFLILFFQPESVTFASFQLSFAAVIGLVCVYENTYLRFTTKPIWYKWIAGILITSLVAGLATAPFALYHFKRYALFGILGNLFTTTIAGVLVMPCLLIATVLMPFDAHSFFLKIANIGIQSITFAATFVSKLPYSVLLTPSMPLWGLILATFGGLFVCLGRGHLRIVGACFFLVGLLCPAFHTTADVLVARAGSLVAFKQKSGSLAFYSLKAEPLTRFAWLADNAQKEENLEKLNCPQRVCIFEKQPFKIAFTRTKNGAIIACQRPDLDVLFLATYFEGACLAKQIIPLSDLYQKATYSVFISDKNLTLENMQEHTGFRPWIPAYPTLDLKSELYLTHQEPPKIKASLR